MLLSCDLRLNQVHLVTNCSACKAKRCRVCSVRGVGGGRLRRGTPYSFFLATSTLQLPAAFSPLRRRYCLSPLAHPLRTRQKRYSCDSKEKWDVGYGFPRTPLLRK